MLFWSRSYSLDVVPVNLRSLSSLIISVLSLLWSSDLFCWWENGIQNISFASRSEIYSSGALHNRPGGKECMELWKWSPAPQWWDNHTLFVCFEMPERFVLDMGMEAHLKSKVFGPNHAIHANGRGSSWVVETYALNVGDPKFNPSVSCSRFSDRRWCEKNYPEVL